MARLDRTSIERVMAILVRTALPPAPSAASLAPRAIPELGEHVFALPSAPTRSPFCTQRRSLFTGLTDG
ncbi:hypothetical protein A2U01_0089706 [Trifolium medium]|uniref:Uncharacterized protein n=1 Tax=Trifolium medium TaxID=97028 RepID=A0A392U9N8_9FABA|nr:hypothetical protein [Trifolium medium]